MASIFLFRHTRSKMNDEEHLVGGRSNHTPLTDLGESQAKQLGLWIAQRKLVPDVIYASPAIRTLATARIALSEAGISKDLIIDDRLQELSQGVEEGKPREEVYHPGVLEQINQQLKDFKFDGGDSMNDVTVRKKEWSEEARSITEHNVIFAFTHGFAIRCYVGDMLGWSHAQIRDNQVDNGSATVLHFGSTGELTGLLYNIDTQTTT